MRSWVGILCVLALAGGSEIVTGGCGRSAGVSRHDAGAPPDTVISSGGLATGGSTSTATGAGGSAALGGSPGGGGRSPTGGNSAAGGNGGSLGGVLLIATYDGQVHATWQNQTSQSIFLGGCGTVEWSRFEGSAWVNHGPFVVCAWEGIAVEVAAGASYTETQSFARAEAGRYRLSGRYGVGCTPGLGLSGAGCTAFFTATSNELAVPATGGTGGAGSGGALGTGGTTGTNPNASVLCGWGACSAGYACCVNPSTGAQDCLPSSSVCSDGFLVSCDGSEDCAEGQHCCMPSGTVTGNACVSGECLTGLAVCHGDTDCPEGQVCCPKVSFGYSHNRCTPGTSCS
jgi:hypothetical protein